jgi:hypothetical protein
MITYRIHQIKDIANTIYAFREYDPEKFNFADYECMGEGEFAAEAETAIEICDIIFHVFNMRKPADFEGHSLSVSDIIEITTDITQSFYYCNPVGWIRIK